MPEDKTASTLKPKPKQKHRPSALSLNSSTSKMQDIAVDILSPGLNEAHLDSAQRGTVELSRSIEQQQRELIASKNQKDASPPSSSSNIKTTTVSGPSVKKRTIATPTIIIEQVSTAGTNSANSGALSPLPLAKKFKRNKAPPPLKIASEPQNIAPPSIQTAPIRNASSQFAHGVRAANHRATASRRQGLPVIPSPFAPRFLAGSPAAGTHAQAQAQAQIAAAAQQAAAVQAAAAAAQAAVLSPLASAFFAPRYYPVVPSGAVATPPVLTPGFYNPYYRSLYLKNSQANTPKNSQSFNLIIAPPGAPAPGGNIHTPTTSINGGMPITPLNYAFQNRPILTSLENYMINRNERSTLSELNKNALKSKKKDQAEPSKPTAPAPAENDAKKEPETQEGQKPALDESVPRKTLQNPTVTPNIVKQTISTKQKKASGEPKTPIHLQKANTPHVTDVFPNEMAKFAPVSNQPLSARDEHFDFNLYRDESLAKPEEHVDQKAAQRASSRTGRRGRKRKSAKKENDVAEEEDEEEEEEEEDEDDVESKAIEDGGRINNEF